MRAHLVTLLIAGSISCFSLFAYGQPPDRSWKRISLPGHGAIDLQVPDAWRVSATRAADNKPPNIEFGPRDGNTFAVLLSVLWSDSNDPRFNELHRVLELVKVSRDRSAPSATQEQIPLHTIRGEQLQGYYFSVADRDPNPKQWRYMTQGSAAIRDLLITFTILSHDPEHSEATTTIEMLEKARRSDDRIQEEKDDDILQEGNRVIDRLGQFSLSMPEQWHISESSRGGDLKVQRSDDGPYCWIIRMDPSPFDVEQQFEWFRYAQPGGYKKWTKVRQRWRRLDGEMAGYIEARRTKHDGDTFYAWNVVVVHESAPYIIDCAVAETEAKASKAQVTKILDSFRWQSKSGN